MTFSISTTPPMQGWVGVGKDDTDGDDVEVDYILLRSALKGDAIPHDVSSETLKTCIEKRQGGWRS